MLLYPLTALGTRSWVLDLTAPPLVPPEASAHCVYALVPTRPPLQIYIGSTMNLQRRLRQHLTLTKAELSKGPRRASKSSATAVLGRVIQKRSGLLVIRLETVPPRNRRLRRLLELSWLIVAAREELPEQKKRGPTIEWSGDAGDLRKAFALARKRHWPGQWVTTLRPLCESRCLPELPPSPPPPRLLGGRPRGRTSKAAEPKTGGAKGAEAPGRAS